MQSGMNRVRSVENLENWIKFCSCGRASGYIHSNWDKIQTSSSIEGNQKDILVQADAIIMYLGLN